MSPMSFDSENDTIVKGDVAGRDNIVNSPDFISSLERLLKGVSAGNLDQTFYILLEKLTTQYKAERDKRIEDIKEVRVKLNVVYDERNLCLVELGKTKTILKIESLWLVMLTLTIIYILMQ